MDKELTHGEKLRLAGIKRYGSEEAWKIAQAENGRSASHPGTGGFAYMAQHDPSRLKYIAKKAINKRYGRDYNPEDHYGPDNTK